MMNDSRDEMFQKIVFILKLCMVTAIIFFFCFCCYYIFFGKKVMGTVTSVDTYRSTYYDSKGRQRTKSDTRIWVAYDYDGDWYEKPVSMLGTAREGEDIRLYVSKLSPDKPKAWSTIIMIFSVDILVAAIGVAYWKAEKGNLSFRS